MKERKIKKRGPEHKRKSRRRSDGHDCTNCGKVLKKDEINYRHRIKGKSRYFCSEKCLDIYKWKRQAPSLVIGVVFLSIMLTVLFSAVPWSDILPEEEVTHDPEIDRIIDRDIRIKNVKPQGDDYHTEMEVEILLTNRGKGSTGRITIEVLAENSTSKVIDDCFNTSRLRSVEDGTINDRIPPMKSYVVNGLLNLRPGRHTLWIMIYEEGLRDIEGTRYVQVFPEQVIYQPWDGGDSSRDSPKASEAGDTGAAPGFEITAFIIVIAVIYLVKTRRVKVSRKRGG